MPHVLIVDDDRDAAESLGDLVVAQGCSVSCVDTLADARHQIALQPPDLLLLDLVLPGGHGMALMRGDLIAGRLETVVCGAHPPLDPSSQALRLGAVDYLVKPIDLRHLRGMLSRIAKPAARRSELAQLEAQLERDGHFGALWGRSPAMRRVYRQISQVAGTSVTVFVTGESGTGKELVAQTVHELGPRRDKPLLAVNCGAIAADRFDSELFGHEKGSFPGADQQHLGVLERAAGGTLFLDEVTAMPSCAQAGLLRALETGRFKRVGGTLGLEADVRLIAATRCEPLQAVAAGRLREDLLHRLDVFPIHVPALRERLDDVPLLARHFLAGIGAREGRARHFTEAATRRLAAHAWPGNVRELRSVVQRAYVEASGASVDNIELHRSTARPPTSPGGTAVSGRSDRAAPAPGARRRPSAADTAAAMTVAFGTRWAQVERELILRTLRQTGFHRERTARALGISSKTLYNRLRAYGVDVPEAALRCRLGDPEP